MGAFQRSKNKHEDKQTELQILQFFTGKQLQIVHNYVSQTVGLRELLRLHETLYNMTNTLKLYTNK